jgi:glycerol transport system ATP-binding protein
VAAVLFDEPLTVIDPHLKWQLRRKLKQIHHELKLTLIYVTHDQVEALTFAEEVVVMTRGRAVQVGSAEALFERPAHTFVGHFIGSPGMNFLPVTAGAGALQVAGRRLPLPSTPRGLPEGALKLGVRPEYVQVGLEENLASVPATVVKVQDVGTHQMLTAQVGGEHLLKVRVAQDQALPAAGATVWLQVLGDHTCFYRDEALVD